MYSIVEIALDGHFSFLNWKKIMVAFVFLFFAVVTLEAQTDYVEISVIEENWCATDKPNYVSNCINEKDLFMSRMIFYSKGKEWYSANDKITYSNLDSSICDNCPVFKDQYVFQGTILLGKVRTNNKLIGHCSPEQNSYNRNFALSTAFEIVDQTTVPKVLNYEGSYTTSHFPSTYRPLIALSHKKQYPLQHSVQNGYAQESIGIYSFIEDSLMNNKCVAKLYDLYNLYQENYCLNVKGNTDSIGYSIASVDIDFFQKHFIACDSTKGVKLMENFCYYNLEKRRNDLWRIHNNAVFILKGRDAIYLDSRMELVDFGDYNGDGKLEWIFKYTESFYDAYVMYYNDFNSRVECGWSLHTNYKL